VWFSGGRQPGITPLRVAAGSRAAVAPGSAPGRATGTQLQMAVLQAWVGEEGGFPDVLGFCSFFIIMNKSDRYVGETLILDTVPLKSFSPSVFFEKFFYSLAYFQQLLPFLVPLSLRGKKKKALNQKQQQRIK